MKKLPLLLSLLCGWHTMVSAFPSSQTFQVSYCDESRLNTQIPRIPNFMRSRRDISVEKGYMALYEHVILNALGTISIHAGANLGNWITGDDQIVTGSAFLSGRLWVFHLLFIHPYFEYSLFGPTITSKDHYNGMQFKSNFLFQNFFGIGVEVGANSGFTVDVKTIRYYEAENFQPHDGFRVPIVASIGFTF